MDSPKGTYFNTVEIEKLEEYIFENYEESLMQMCTTEASEKYGLLCDCDRSLTSICDCSDAPIMLREFARLRAKMWLTLKTLSALNKLISELIKFTQVHEDFTVKVGNFAECEISDCIYGSVDQYIYN